VAANLLDEIDRVMCTQSTDNVKEIDVVLFLLEPISKSKNAADSSSIVVFYA